MCQFDFELGDVIRDVIHNLLHNFSLQPYRGVGTQHPDDTRGESIQDSVAPVSSCMFLELILLLLKF